MLFRSNKHFRLDAALLGPERTETKSRVDSPERVAQHPRPTTTASVLRAQPRRKWCSQMQEITTKTSIKEGREGKSKMREGYQTTLGNLEDLVGERAVFERVAVLLRAKSRQCEAVEAERCELTSQSSQKSAPFCGIRTGDFFPLVGLAARFPTVEEGVSRDSTAAKIGRAHV